MPAYRFKTVDAHGRHDSGLIQADTARLAREVLRQRGLIVLDVQAVESGTARPGAEKHSLTLARLGLMLGQLASILRAGVPLDRALEACGAATAGEVEKDSLAALRADVLAGFPLSQAMARQPRVFDAFCVATVRAGERSGLLDQVLSRLAEHLDRRAALGQKIQLALLYPALLVGVSLLIVIGLLQFVVPQVAGVFAHNQQALPVLTRALLATSAALKGNGLWLLVVLAGLCWGAVRLWRRLPGLRARAQRALLGAPALGPILAESDIARVTATLALLGGSGVPLVAALGACADVATLDRTRQGVRQACAAVEEGASLKRALQDTGVFPPLLVLLVGSGEESGRLPQMLQEAADRLASSAELRMNTLVRLFEPAVVLIMGFAVLLIVLAVLLPIFEMNQLVK